MRITKKKVGMALGLLVVLGGGAAAFAFFTGGGSGNGQANVGSSTNWLVDNVSNLGTLLPGTGTSTLTYRITNQSAASQQVTAVAVSVPADGSGNVFDTVTSGYKVGCLAAWFTPDNAGTTFKDNANTATTIPKTLLQNGYITGTTSVTMGEPGVNQDACKLVSPRLIVTVS